MAKDWWVDFTSVVVEADSKEEAEKQAQELINTKEIKRDQVLET